MQPLTSLMSSAAQALPRYATAAVSMATTTIFTLNRIILLLVRRPSRTKPPGTAPSGCVSLEVSGNDWPGKAGNQAGLGEIGRHGPLHGAIARWCWKVGEM